MQPNSRLWPAYRRYLQRSNRPVLVGPFRSEVGFEALYMIPFVQALGLDPARVIPVTRGGAAIWYNTGHGVELYDLREPKDVRIENTYQHKKTGELKQNTITPWDRAVLKDAAAAAGLTRYHVLHPAWMYQVLRPFWQAERGLEWVWPHLTRAVEKGRGMDGIPAIPLPEGTTIPANACAVRFYLRATLPNTDLTHQLASASIQRIAQQQPVILLNSDVHADEHVDLALTGPNIFRLKDLVPSLTPQNNLAVQSAVIAQCMGFVGTYGGLAQLALRMGKPSVSYYTQWHGTALAHKTLSEVLAANFGVPFLTVRLADLPLLKGIVPDVTITGGGSSSHSQPAKERRAQASSHVEH